MSDPLISYLDIELEKNQKLSSNVYNYYSKKSREIIQSRAVSVANVSGGTLNLTIRSNSYNIKYFSN